MSASQRPIEIGNLPSSWEILPCDEICEKISVGIVVRPSSYYVPNGVPAFRSQNVRQDHLQLQPMVYISEEANDGAVSKSKLSAGDVLMVRTGYPGTSCVVPPEFDGANCIDLIIIRPKAEKIRSEFLSRFFGSEVAMLQVQSGKGGLAQQHFNVGAVKRMLIAVPPLPEQKKIAHILSTVQRAIEEQERIIQTTTELKKALMHKLFTEGLRSEPQKQTEIGLVPESWEVVEIGDLGKCVTGSTPKTEVASFYEPPSEDFVAHADLGARRYVYHSQKKISPEGMATIRSIPKNSVMCVCIGSSIGKVGMTYHEESATNQQINSIICKVGRDPEFIFFLLSYHWEYWKSYATFGPVPILSKGRFTSIAIPLPGSIEEQKEIAKPLAALEAKVEAAEKKVAVLKDLFRTLLHELMTATTRVHEI